MVWRVHRERCRCPCGAGHSCCTVSPWWAPWWHHCHSQGPGWEFLLVIICSSESMNWSTGCFSGTCTSRVGRRSIWPEFPLPYTFVSEVSDDASIVHIITEVMIVFCVLHHCRLLCWAKRSRFGNSLKPILANTDRFCKPVTTEKCAHLQNGNDCSVLQRRWQLVMLLSKYI